MFPRAKKPKFNADQAEAIRQGHCNGVSYRNLAKIYKTDKNTVMNICRYQGAYRRNRKWVQEG